MHTYTVSELTQKIEISLKEKFTQSINVEGEISNFSASMNGHWYFTLKDNTSQIQAVMFKGVNSSTKKPVKWR